MVEYFYNASFTNIADPLTVLGTPTVFEKYEYDKLGRTKKITRKDGSALSYLYYTSSRATGESLGVILPNNSNSENIFQIKKDNRVLREFLNYNRFNKPTIVKEFFDPNNANSYIQTTSLYYETDGEQSFGQLKSETTRVFINGAQIGQALKVGYRYDLLGNVKKIIYPTEEELNFNYNEENILNQVWRSDGVTLLEYILDEDFRIPKEELYYKIATDMTSDN